MVADTDTGMAAAMATHLTSTTVVTDMVTAKVVMDTVTDPGMAMDNLACVASMDPIPQGKPD
jgi:hypothetical protein